MPGVIGHNFCPRMHNATFATDGGVAGFDITMPHKQPMLAFVDETVNLAGAVNTVVAGEGRLWGINTDGSGLVEACEEAGVIPAGQWVLILGAGAAVAVPERVHLAALRRRSNRGQGRGASRPTLGDRSRSGGSYVFFGGGR